MSTFKVIKSHVDNLEVKLNQYPEFSLADSELSRPEEAVAILQRALTLQNSKTATAGGDITPDTGYDAMKKVVVPLQNKTVSIATLVRGGTITCDSGYAGLGTITLEA